MSDKRFSDFLSVVIFVTAIIGAVVFAYCELKMCFDIAQCCSWLFCILAIISVVLVVIAFVRCFICKEHCTSTTKYLLIEPTKTGGQILSITKSDNSNLIQNFDKITTIKISKDFIDLPEKFLDKIKRKGKKIEII